MNNDIQITISNEKLLDILMHSATRDDIAQLRTEIRGLRTEIHDDTAKFKAELRDDMAKFKAETYNKFATIDTQFIEVNNRFNQVELKIEKAKNQMLLLMGTFSIFFLGILAKGFHWL